MNVFFVRDTDPQGGYFAIHEKPPVLSDERVTVVEVRKGEFPEKTLKDIYTGGIIECHPEYHYDEVIIPYWESATVWWTREEGYALKGGNNE